MKVTERRLRHHALGRYVNTYTASLWGRRLVRELRLARERTAAHATLLPLDVAQLRSFYERSRRRLLVLEYDGALAPHASLPRLAQPSPTLVSALRALCADARTMLYTVLAQSKGASNGRQAYSSWRWPTQGVSSRCFLSRTSVSSSPLSSPLSSPPAVPSPGRLRVARGTTSSSSDALRTRASRVNRRRTCT